MCMTNEAAAIKLAERDNLVGELVEALSELHCLVWGECPSLLNEDSGGNPTLDLEIKEVLAKAREGAQS